MRGFKHLSHWPVSGFWLGMGCIFALSVGLRFWGLSRFNALVFDEVYFAKFANNYLTQTEFFDGHPPLAKYLIAIGIWIGSHLPFGSETQNTLIGSLRTTWSYRWLNALTGSFIPLIVAAIAYELNHKRSYALIAALFAVADGLFLVESRYALVNVYLIIFGLLGQYFFLKGAANAVKAHWGWLSLAGIFFGASFAVKWNGLGFLLGAYITWIGALLWQWVRGRNALSSTPLQRVSQLNVLAVVINLAVVPAIIYSLAWIPHIQLNPKYDFWEVNRQIMGYHQRVGNGSDIHPYCSNWISWPFMIRPVLYFYDRAGGSLEINPSLPSLPEDSGTVVYAVHAMGNPILWWFSTAAIALLILVEIARFCEQIWGDRRPMPYDWITLYLVGNYLANWLPWAKVTRCLFLYHYMGSSIFSGLAIAWLVQRWLRSDRLHLRASALTVIFLIAIAFVFWMPVYLGLPLSPAEWKLRMWFPSWI